MKSDRLLDAIGMIDPKLIERADKPARRPMRWIKWTAPVAAALVVAIGLGLFFGQKSTPSQNPPVVPSETPAALKKYVAAEAVYPAMAPYPTAERFSEKYRDQYDAWLEDRGNRRHYNHAGDHLDEFFETTMREFLAQSDSKNLAYSPLNVYMALAMLAETTDGNSRAQILHLLGAKNIETLRTQANSVWNANYANDGLNTNILANSVWLNENLSYRQDTLDTLANDYYASAYRGKMGSTAFNEALQAWINWQTGNLLEEQVKDLEMSPETVMSLVSTIYFHAQWSNNFSETDNTEKVFHGAESDATCTFMNRTEPTGTYYWGEHFSAINLYLDMGGGNMWFFLPEEGYTTQELLQDDEFYAFLMLRDKEEWSKQTFIRIHMSIPKLDIASELRLEEGLQNLGVTDCFDSTLADFSPLTEQDAFVSKIEHGVRLAIDENGVTAAAYTTIMAVGSAKPPEDEIDFVLDRPFVFAINNGDSLPLFVGTVNQL